MFLLEQVVNGLVLGGYYLLIALGLSLIFSVGGIVNLAHGDFVTLGAFTLAALQHAGGGQAYWIALLVALKLAPRVAGLVGIAAAPDFTEDLLWAVLPPDKRETLQREGVLYQPSQYSERPYGITHELIRDGRKHLLLQIGRAHV